MNYRQRINQLVKDASFGSEEYQVALYAFEAHQKLHGEVKPTKNVENGDFFAEGGSFDTFLGIEYDENVIIDACVRMKTVKLDNERASKMIEEGERMIREAYRIRDRNSIVYHADFMGERERSHSVSLVGIHDGEGKEN